MSTIFSMTDSFIQETSVIDIENTMLEPLDIMFFKRDHKMHRNGEAHNAIPRFDFSLINRISIEANMVCYLSCIILAC